MWVSAIGEPLSTAFELGALCCLINRKPGFGLSRGLVFALILYAGALLTHETAILFGAIVAAYVFLFEASEERPAGRIVSRGPHLRAVRGSCGALHGCTPERAGGQFSFRCSSDQQLWHRARHYRGQSASQLGRNPDDPAGGPARISCRARGSMAGRSDSSDRLDYPSSTGGVSGVGCCGPHCGDNVGAAWRSSHRRIYLFCAVWSVIPIAPALNLNALWDLVDDRYLYAPSFGWSLAVATAVDADCCVRKSARAQPRAWRSPLFWWRSVRRSADRTLLARRRGFLSAMRGE